MGRTTRKLNLKAQWNSEYELYQMYQGTGCVVLPFGQPRSLAHAAVRILKELPGPVDNRRRAG